MQTIPILRPEQWQKYERHKASEKRIEKKLERTAERVRNTEKKHATHNTYIYVYI